MIIGNGQLAQVFEDLNIPNTVIFASGVADSNCTERKEFQREETLLREVLLQNKEKKFVYFSSCALSAPEYPKNDYYTHKSAMEKIIKENSNRYYIFRIPQLFGSLKNHKTLINFIYYAIINNINFNIYTNAYRYVVEIGDVRHLVEMYMKYNEPNEVLDLSNNYRYKVEEIVGILEGLLHKKASCQYIDKTDAYCLDLSKLEHFIESYNIPVSFGKDYLRIKLQEKVDELYLEKNNV